MSLANFIIGIYDIDKDFIGNRVISAEGCAGLYVHRTFLDTPNASPWRVSNVIGRRMYSGMLNSRRQARTIAHEIAAIVPAEVLSGEWSGEEWAKHDPETAEDYRKRYYSRYCA